MEKASGGKKGHYALGGAAAFLLTETALSSYGTQNIAAELSYHPALGHPMWGHLYQPFGWMSWLFEPWAKPMMNLFTPVGTEMMALALGGALVARLVADGGRTPKKHPALHGTGGFAEKEAIENAGVLDADDGVYIGAWKDGRQVHYLRHDGPEHVAGIAPTRSGKGVGLVIPTLLSWLHSAVIFDEKGELWELTAGWRKEEAGNTVLRWQPGDPDKSCGFNFLDEVRLNTEFEVADASNIAIMLVDPDGKGFKDHWDKTAYSLITGTILHVMYKMRGKGEVASLPDVAAALSDPSRHADRLYEEMAHNKHLSGSAHPKIATVGRDQLNRVDKERASVLSTATTYLELFQDPIVARNSRHSDFRIADVMNHEKPVSLYIMVPGSDKLRLRPLVRLMLTMLIKKLTGVPIGFDDNRQPVMPHKHRLLFMLDEFPSLGRLAVFEDALSKCAGFGIKAYLIMQDLGQLNAAYPHEMILANCHVRIVYAPNKLETAKWVSDNLGTKTEDVETFSESGSKWGRLGNVSRSIVQVSRPVLTPDEVLRLPAPKKRRGKIVKPGELVVFMAGMRAIHGRQILYFEDRVFARRAEVLPPTKTDSLTSGRFKVGATNAVQLVTQGAAP